MHAPHVACGAAESAARGGGGAQVRIARIFNTYGPRMALDDGRVVSNFVAQALKREPLTVYGDGSQTRSFQYVSDLVAGLMALMDNEEHVGPFNLGNPGEFTMNELAEVVKEVVDPTATVVYKPNTADDPSRRKPDITKATTLLGWAPKVAARWVREGGRARATRGEVCPARASRRPLSERTSLNVVSAPELVYACSSS